MSVVKLMNFHQGGDKLLFSTKTDESWIRIPIQTKSLPLAVDGVFLQRRSNGGVYEVQVEVFKPKGSTNELM